MPKCSITQSGDSYAIKTPFSRQFVDELKKSVPMANRKFDGESKCWIVTPLFAEMAAQIVQEYFGEKPMIPELKPVELSQKYSFQLDYVGIPKDRPGETEKTALGLSKSDWRILTVTGSITVGRLRVSEILNWSDIENDQGQVMVSSWDRDLNAVRMEWV